MNQEFNPRDLPGLKRRDVRQCICCDRGVAHDNQLTFYQVKIASCALLPREIQRMHALENFLGGGRAGAALADAMGPDEDLAKILGEHTVWICQECGLGMSAHVPCIAEMSERAESRARRAEQEAAGAGTIR